MPEINLLKNELDSRRFFPWRNSPVAVYVAGAIAVLMVLIYAGLMVYDQNLQRQIKAQEQATAGVNSQISRLDSDRQTAVSLQSRLVNLEILLQHHLAWSRIFAELEKYAYKSAVFTDLQVNQGENRLLLSGAVPNYSDLGKLILGLGLSPNFTDVTLQNSGQKQQTTQTGYAFTIQITFNQNLLIYRVLQ